VTSLDRDCRRAIGLGFAAVAGASCLVGGLGQPRSGVAFAALSLPSWIVASATLWRARTGAWLGLATRITLLRGLLVSLTAGFAFVPASSVLRLVPAVLYATAALADRLDGAVARRRGEVTAMGAHLDGAMDALGLLAAPLVAVMWGRLPPWYLALGAAYYVYQGAIGVRRLLGLPLHPERVARRPLTRTFAGLQMVLVAAALPPVLPFAVTAPAATVLMLPTLAFFVNDWLLITGRWTADPSAPPTPAMPAVRR
jgi:CDP-diacylglycerol--glycerol-3-phosphate 3-phosphatidyltransferase